MTTTTRTNLVVSVLGLVFGSLLGYWLDWWGVLVAVPVGFLVGCAATAYRRG